MKLVATGMFEVKLAPLALGEVAAQSQLGRMSIDKRYQGALLATSQGEMLSFRSAVHGSAGYVAMERVTGSVEGKQGSFVLQHSSTMSRGLPAQSIRVVPDSGTEELTGLSGSMTIEITEGQHRYAFEYELGGAV